MTRLVPVVLLVALAACKPMPTPAPSPTPTAPVPTPVPTPTPAPTPKPVACSQCYDCEHPAALSGIQRVAKPIKGRYIVVFNRPPALSALAHGQLTIQRVNTLAAKFGLKNVRTFAHLGATSVSTDGINILSVAKDPSVAYVQEDGTKHASDVDWGLDRIDQRALPLDHAYSPDGDGAGVHIVSIDTGVTGTADLGSRLQADCFTAVLDGLDCADGNGHGTHTMGSAAGTVWGVARKVLVHASRVLDASGSGSDSDVIAGIEFATQLKMEHPDWPVVANMSLGGSPAPALDAAVCASIAAGVTYAIAGGNEGAPAYTSSPARVRQAITVAASDRTDAMPSWSNYGLPTDIVAPGVDITSDTPDGGTASESGTSMATPHVAGAAALYLGKHPGATPAQVEAALVAAATKGALKGTLKPNTPNLLLYVLGF